MRKFFSVSLFVLIVGAIVFFMGPRPIADETITFDTNAIGSDLETYLSQSEANVANIVEGAEKEIIWADPVGKQKTAVSVVYIHGFSATKYETRPVSDIVARDLNANLFYTRLTGHGADGDALGNATVNQWVNDTVEAIKIGEMIGEKVLLVATSTGGTLATWAANQPELMKNVIGIAFMSPNFEVQGASIELMNMPWIATLLPFMIGENQSFETVNADHKKWWTTSYPSKAILPMGALLKVVSEIDFSALKTPALFIYSNKDQVVKPERTALVADQWGGPKKSILIEESGDASFHVNAGDIRSPQNTQSTADNIVAWFRSLGG